MPSSGYGMVDVLAGLDKEKNYDAAKYILEQARVAMTHGLFVEWLECFLAAWESTKDPWAAAAAGGQEWDF